MRIAPLILLTLSITLVPAEAQQQPTAAPTYDGKVTAPKPEPTPEMKRLAELIVGTWKVTEKHEPRRLFPAGGSGSGTAVFRLGPGGLSVIEDYSSDNPWGSFVEHGMIWWSPEAGGFQRIECENITAGGCEVKPAAGRWEGNSIVFISNLEQNGRKVQYIERFAEITRDSFTVTWDASVDGGRPRRVMTIRHQRVS